MKPLKNILLCCLHLFDNSLTRWSRAITKDVHYSNFVFDFLIKLQENNFSSFLSCHRHPFIFKDGASDHIIVVAVVAVVVAVVVVVVIAVVIIIGFINKEFTTFLQPKHISTLW